MSACIHRRQQMAGQLVDTVVFVGVRESVSAGDVLTPARGVFSTSRCSEDRGWEVAKTAWPQGSPPSPRCFARVRQEGFLGEFGAGASGTPCPACAHCPCPLKPAPVISRRLLLSGRGSGHLMFQGLGSASSTKPSQPLLPRCLFLKDYYYYY